MEATQLQAICDAGDREQLSAMARVASAARRYEDMLFFMKSVVKSAGENDDALTETERTRLWEACKNVVNALRDARREILAEEELLQKDKEIIEAPLLKSGHADVDAGSPLPPSIDQLKHTADVGIQTEELDAEETTHNGGDGDDSCDSAEITLLDDAIADDYGNDGGHFQAISYDNARLSEQDENQYQNMQRLLGLYRQMIEDRIYSLCKDFVKLLDDEVHAPDEESKAFFMKLKGDCLRYICEVQTGESREATANEVLFLYKAAEEIAKRGLPGKHPLRLGLALNFAVFYVDILGSRARAIQVSQEALQAATDLSGDSLTKESERILELLEENIKIWSLDDGGVF